MESVYFPKTLIIIRYLAVNHTVVSYLCFVKILFVKMLISCHMVIDVNYIIGEAFMACYCC